MLYKHELGYTIEALELGLVSEATEDGDVLNRAGMLAGRIADNSAVAVQQCIRTLRMKEVRHRSFATHVYVLLTLHEMHAYSVYCSLFQQLRKCDCSMLWPPPVLPVLVLLLLLCAAALALSLLQQQVTNSTWTLSES
jgi:hypothetical protein